MMSAPLNTSIRPAAQHHRVLCVLPNALTMEVQSNGGSTGSQATGLPVPTDPGYWYAKGSLRLGSGPTSPFTSPAGKLKTKFYDLQRVQQGFVG